jgi:adenylate cyclase, class 2
MNTEIEVKFANVDHDTLRQKLTELGAVCEQPNRLMRRVVIHTPDMSQKSAFIRIRDEGYRTTITYKQFDSDTIDGAKEYEVVVSDFDEAIRIFTAGGLEYDVFQESKRENWRLGDVEIMLDEWPWIKPYIEIEGPSEEKVMAVASQLDFDWHDALFGGVANIYKHQYPYTGPNIHNIINQEWKMIRFDDPMPEILTN